MSHACTFLGTSLALLSQKVWVGAQKSVEVEQSLPVQIVPFGGVDYVKLVIFQKQKIQEKPLTFPLKEFRDPPPEREVSS